MLTKLAIRNIKRSISDYLLYVITITLILSLMFAFNSMMFSDLILNMNAHMADYKTLLILFSVVVLVVVAWLVNYMTKFMLEKRSREFGTYLLLGMENSEVSKLFFYENIIFGIVALLLACFVGSFVFQGLVIIVTTFFGEEYHLEATFSMRAMLLTIAYYFVIQIIVIFRNNRYLKTLKICDLMKVDKVNEQVKVKHVTRNVILFVCSLVSGVIACTKAPVIIVVISLIFFIYGFYMGISGILVLLIDKTKYFKYRKMHVFVFRQIASKINTMGFTMGTISVLFTLALLSGNYAIGLSNYKAEITRQAPFDICLTDLDQDEDFTQVRQWLQEKEWVKKDLAYSIYRGEQAVLREVLERNQVLGGYFQYDTFMKVSDYNTLRTYLGLEEITLQQGEYAIHCVASVSRYYTEWVENTPDMTIVGENYTCQGVYTEDFSQNGQNGAGYVAIVPDFTAEQMEVYYSQYVCDTLKDTNDELYEELKQYVPQDAEYWASSAQREGELDHGMGIDSIYAIFDNIMVKNGGLVSEVEAAIITVVSSIFYVALVFICVALTILAIQQLSDSTKYKYRYRVLWNMGVDENERAKLIRQQLIIYFGCPVVIPVLISMLISFRLNSIMVMGTQIQTGNYMFFVVAMLLFLLVYSVYFSVTYLCFKKNVQ